MNLLKVIDRQIGRMSLPLLIKAEVIEARMKGIHDNRMATYIYEKRKKMFRDYGVTLSDIEERVRRIK